MIWATMARETKMQVWKRLNAYWWLPFGLLGVALVWLVGAFWNFAHGYILAGGDSPLVILEGSMPTWNGTALSVGLASVGSDIVKAVAGFAVVAALFNRNLSWTMRTATIAIALPLCVATFMWSARSAVGMAALTFGDAIAGRKVEQAAATGLANRIEQGQARLKWLEQQTTCTKVACRANAQEASELRRELKENRAELRGSRIIGAGDPGGRLIAEAVAGASEEQVTRWTVLLLVATVELIATLGFPVLALATTVATATPARDFVTPPKVAAEPEAEIEIVAAKSDPEGGDQKKSEKSPSKLNGHKGNFELRADASEQKSASLPFASGSEAEIEIGNEVGDDLRRPQRERRTKMGRPRKGALGDGHLDDWCDQVFGEGKKPTWRDYKLYCKSIHLAPMSRGEMWRGIKRYEGVGKKALGLFFEPDRREAIVTQH